MPICTVHIHVMLLYTHSIPAHIRTFSAIQSCFAKSVCALAVSLCARLLVCARMQLLQHSGPLFYIHFTWLFLVALPTAHTIKFPFRSFETPLACSWWKTTNLLVTNECWMFDMFYKLDNFITGWSRRKFINCSSVCTVFVLAIFCAQSQISVLYCLCVLNQANVV